MTCDPGVDEEVVLIDQFQSIHPPRLTAATAARSAVGDARRQAGPAAAAGDDQTLDLGPSVGRCVTIEKDRSDLGQVGAVGLGDVVSNIDTNRNPRTLRAVVALSVIGVVSLSDSVVSSWWWCGG